MLLIGAVANFDYAVFIWAARRVDTAVVAVLFETWPIFYIATASLWDRPGLTSGNLGAARRYRSLAAGQLALIAVAVCGAAMIVYSADGNLPSQPESSNILLGCAAAVVAAILTSLAWSEVVWGAAAAVRAGPESAEPPLAVEGGCVMLASLLGTLVWLPMGLAVGVGVGGSFTGLGLVAVFLAGFVLLTAAVVCFRESNLRAGDLSVNALSAVGSVLALVWLFWFIQIDISQPVLFVTGALAVIIAGALIQRSTG